MYAFSYELLVLIRTCTLAFHQVEDELGGCGFATVWTSVDLR